MLKDATTEGMNLSKDLIITCDEDSPKTITFDNYGIALWGSLNFENVKVKFVGIGATPYPEWKYYTICAGANSSVLRKVHKLSILM